MYRTTRFISAMVLLMLYLHLQGKVGATCGLMIMTEAREPRIVNLKPPASQLSTQHSIASQRF